MKKLIARPDDTGPEDRLPLPPEQVGSGKRGF